MSLSRRLANLGKAIDSATTGHFLSKGDSDGLFETIQYTDLTGRPTVLDSANITSLIDSAYIQLRQTTSGGSGGLDSAAITNLVDSAYVSARSPAAASGFAAYEYNTSAAQTTFQDSDVNGNVLSYSENGIIVYYNGVLMPTSDYTATDGSSVVFTTAVDSGGTVTIAKWALASSGGAGGASGPSWNGDRGVWFGGNQGSTYGDDIQYIDITTPGNATFFGNLSAEVYYGAATSDGTYGVEAFGTNTSNTIFNTLEYITIASTGNSTDFGDLTETKYGSAFTTDGTYGYIAGGWNGSGRSNVIEYITIASPGNGTDFGDLVVSGGTPADGSSGCSDTTYSVIGLGNAGLGGLSEIIHYFTNGTPSNSSDFGDFSENRYSAAAAEDATYGVFAGGWTGVTRTNSIDYITIQTPSNATDFGDLNYGLNWLGGTSNNTYAVFGGGLEGGAASNYMDYVTIQTPSNATDFGDLLRATGGTPAASGSPS